MADLPKVALTNKTRVVYTQFASDCSNILIQMPYTTCVYTYQAVKLYMLWLALETCGDPFLGGTATVTVRTQV